MQKSTQNILSKTSKCKKKFQFQGQQCIYENTQLSRKITNIDGQTSQVKILNHSCQNEGGLFEKTIQIKIKDRYLFIKDVYDFGGKSLQLKNLTNGLRKDLNGNEEKNGSSTDSSTKDKPGKNSEAKKKFIFRKVNEQTHQQKNFSRNTKNVAKNCCKAFLQHLKTSQNKAIYTKLKNLISTTKYNNTLIYIMIQDQQIRPSFMDFLQNKAEKWIQDSKLFNKDIQREGVKLYIQLIQKHTQNNNVIRIIQDQKKVQEDQYFMDDEQQSQQQQQLQ